MQAYLTSVEYALFISSADHRVIQLAVVRFTVMPLRMTLIAGIVVNERKHYLHQHIWLLAAFCNAQ